METCGTYTGERMYFSTDEPKWIRKIMKYREERPDDVEILAEPETNDGCLYCTVPSSWLKVQPPQTRHLSEEKRRELAERLAKARNKNTGDDAHGEEDDADGES